MVDHTKKTASVQRPVPSSAKRSALRRLTKAAKRRMKDRILSSIETGLKNHLGPAIEEGSRRLLGVLADPARAERLQSLLATGAQAAIDKGFARDPHAALLFEFVAWCEAQHGRAQVLRVVLTHSLLFEHEVLEHLQALLSQPGLASRPPSHDSGPRIVEKTQRRLVELLAMLASLHYDPSPPSALQDQADYFRHADIPSRFQPLMSMALAEPGAFSSTRRPSRVAQPQTSEALQRLVPSLNDPHLRFLIFSHLFFVQTYLVKSIVERLPETLADLANYERELRSHQARADGNTLDMVDSR